LKLFPGNAIVPSTEEFDGVDTGALDFAVNVPSFWKGMFPAAGLFCYQSAGPTPIEMLGWLQGGGGHELLEKMIEGHNVHLLKGSGLMGTPEICLSSTVPVTKPEDIVGLKIRVAGDGGEVLGRMGAAMVFMPSSEIYQSAQRGVIDAWDCSNPTVDWTMSIHEVAPYRYLGAVRQPSEYGIMMVNGDTWRELPDDLKVLVSGIASIAPMRTLYQLMAEDAYYTQEMIDYGNNVSFWSPELTVAMQVAAVEFYDEKSAADPFYGEIIQSARAYVEALRTAFPRY